MTTKIETSESGWQAREPLVALLRAVAAGDHGAMAELYDRSSGLVYGTTLKILRDPAAAEDVAIEVFSLIWRKALQFDPQRGGPLSWILTLARNRAIDRLRSRRREPWTDSGDGIAHAADLGPDPEECASLDQRRGLVRAALAGLPRDQRDLIELAYYGGLSHSQIATTTEIPLGTIKTRIRSGMMHLRAILEGDGVGATIGAME